jgi:AraC family transcriptional regulator
MQPEIKTFTEKNLVGQRLRMSLAGNRTPELWQQFMQRRKEIKNAAGPDLYSVEVYNPMYFERFDPKNEFEKWAAIEVTDFDALAAGLETIVIPGGLYAVFLHKGTASQAVTTYQYIFGTWLPNADYVLDDRPHLAVMGAKYKNDDPYSEETLWIPIRAKGTPTSV